MAVFRSHKAIVASGSRYLVEVFKTYPEIKQVTIPEPYNPDYENSSDD